jgi:hypothetical protein
MMKLAAQGNMVDLLQMMNIKTCRPVMIRQQSPDRVSRKIREELLPEQPEGDGNEI